MPAASTRKLTTIRGAARWVDRCGIAALFPVGDLVLPSLWEAVSGEVGVEWAVRDEDGSYISFTPEMARCWRWKDELPSKGLACVGKHLGRWSALVAPRILPALYALTGRPGRPDDFREADLPPLQRELAEAVLDNGPATAPELRALVGGERKQVAAAIGVLQRALVLTNSGLVEQSSGWGAIAVDLLARRWPLDRLPPEEEARRLLAACVLESSGEISAADLAGALGWRMTQARHVLELADRTLVTSRQVDGLLLWKRA